MSEVSDKNEVVGFHIRENGHLGGGHVLEHEGENSVQVVRLATIWVPIFAAIS